MNSYLILINTQGGQIEIHPDHLIDFTGYTLLGTYHANTEEEALANAEEDFAFDYTQPTIPLQLKAYRLYSIC